MQRLKLSVGLSLLLLVSCGPDSDIQSKIHNTDLPLPGGGPWGAWTGFVHCPPGSWAAGFATRTEAKAADNTALNAVRLVCRDIKGVTKGTISAHDGHWGNWSSDRHIAVKAGEWQDEFLSSAELRVEADQGRFRDDTAANNVRFKTTTGNSMEGQGMSWGSWRGMRSCPKGEAISGFRVKMEPKQGVSDDTALNDIIFHCTNYQQAIDKIVAEIKKREDEARAAAKKKEEDDLKAKLERENLEREKREAEERAKKQVEEIKNAQIEKWISEKQLFEGLKVKAALARDGFAQLEQYQHAFFFVSKLVSDLSADLTYSEEIRTALAPGSFTRGMLESLMFTTSTLTDEQGNVIHIGNEEQNIIFKLIESVNNLPRVSHCVVGAVLCRPKTLADFLEPEEFSLIEKLASLTSSANAAAKHVESFQNDIFAYEKELVRICIEAKEAEAPLIWEITPEGC